VAAYEWLGARETEPGLPAHRPAIRQGLLFLGGIATSTLVAGLAVAPFGIYHFHNTQQFAILANLLAIPTCNLVVMPAALAALAALPLGLEALPLALMGWGIEVMVWCAQSVAGLPGAVGRVPAIPTPAFVLMVAGGLWCALWSTRWRLLGLVAIAAGLMLAPTGTRPDVLVGRGGHTVAVRDGDGRLSALGARGATFEIGRWLEHDGDGRTPAEAARAQAFRCDKTGCTARVKGRLLAVAHTPAALRDDCTAAAILVLTFARPAACRPQGALVDADDVRRGGAHALHVEGGRIRIETVAAARGERPWAVKARDDAADSGVAPEPEDDWPARGRRVP
jgi:competence protein ComEC